MKKEMITICIQYDLVKVGITFLACKRTVLFAPHPKSVEPSLSMIVIMKENVLYYSNGPSVPSLLLLYFQILRFLICNHNSSLYLLNCNSRFIIDMEDKNDYPMDPVDDPSPPLPQDSVPRPPATENSTPPPPPAAEQSKMMETSEHKKFQLQI